MRTVLIAMMMLCATGAQAQQCPVPATDVLSACRALLAMEPAPQPTPQPAPQPVPTPTPEPAGAPLFSSGFEPGSFAGTRGSADYASGGVCRRGGDCGAFTIRGGQVSQTMFFWAAKRLAAPRLYTSVWWRFPTHFNLVPVPNGGQIDEHKLLLWETAGGKARLMLDQDRDGRIYFQAMGPDERLYASDRMPWDNQWHRTEVEFARRADGGSVQVWLDGKSILNVPSTRLCMGACTDIIETKVGTYSNGGSTQTETYYADDFEMRTSR